MLLAFASLITNAFGDPGTRRKTRVILAGAVLGFGPVMTLQVLLALRGTRQPEEIVPFWVWALAAMAISLVPLSVAYAVVKHRVMELPVLLRRSARYVLVRRGAVTVAVLLGIVVTFVFAGVLSRLFTDVGEGAQRAGLVVGALFGGVLATAGPRLWRPAQERIDRAFFRGAYDARRILEQLARDSHAATDRDALASRDRDGARGGASARGPVRIPARAGCACRAWWPRALTLMRWPGSRCRLPPPDWWSSRSAGSPWCIDAA